MSNITKLAPYAYLARRSSSGTIYDLYALVPVSPEGTVNLANVQPVKVAGNRILISFTLSAPENTDSLPSYEVKHWEIDNEGTYTHIIIQCEDNQEYSTVMAFADADTEPAASENDFHTFAPYLFIGAEMEGEHMFFRPSCIVIFEENVGATNEGLAFSGNGSTHAITSGDEGNVVSNPENFAVNQNVQHEISSTTYTFEGTVNDNSALRKPIRKGKVRKMWAAFVNNGSIIPSAIITEDSTSANN